MLRPTIADILRIEFPDVHMTFSPEILQQDDPVAVAKFRVQLKGHLAGQAFKQEQALKEETKKYAELALPGCIACADSLIANPEEIATQAVRIGRALAIELRKL
jgi:hypothetical protein